MSKIDFSSDNSFHKFVGPHIGFNDIEYIPSDLVVVEGEYIVDVVHTILKLEPQQIKLEVLEPLNELGEAFFKKFGMNMYIQSAYRDFCKQFEILKSVPKENKKYVSLPGYSEHQTGYALDVINAQSHREDYDIYYDWLAKHLYNFGFHVSYQKGPAVDGYPIEKWHIRYLGIDLSKYLHDNNITFTEFYNKNKTR